MRRRFPAARAKTFLLTGLAPQAPLEVQDPYASGEPAFHACFDHISAAVRPIVRLLSATSQPGADASSSSGRPE